MNTSYPVEIGRRSLHNNSGTFAGFDMGGIQNLPSIDPKNPADRNFVTGDCRARSTVLGGWPMPLVGPYRVAPRAQHGDASGAKQENMGS